MAKVRLATVWLSGCSGCHMSFLDQDEKLLELADKVELVHSPIADIKDFPENVDITLVEGAVGNEEQLELLKKIRRRTRILIAFGDCAVNGNVTALRNILNEGRENVLKRAYVENTMFNQGVPTQIPRLTERVFALNEVVKVDFYIPGCPPPASLINYVLNEFLDGRIPVLDGKFKYG
ncbi:MAG: NADP oxidoreductase [Crenarchaeota archaeon]|nr:NADP oxidoreductase [Thermoproteota archaeon]MDW8034131.1 NADP oxidoreductase [Nitrososphaerota archaeon]